MRVGWLVACALALAGTGVQAQQQIDGARTQTTVTVEIDRGADNASKRAKRMSGFAGTALASGGSAEAAVVAEQALEQNQFNPWAHYRRAAALSDLRRTEEAVAEYKMAEEAFQGVNERGKALAMYGRAFTLAEAGRCAEARPVYEAYAQLVEPKDPKGAAQARSYAQGCQPGEQPSRSGTAQRPRQRP